jgi:predicted transcriptional regulator
MKTKGDRFRRSHCYTEAAVRNLKAANQMAKRYKELVDLIKDDITAEVFQDTYCRITRRYKGGDFVKQFRRLFRNTLREHKLKIIEDNKHIAQYADNKSNNEEAT